MKTLIIPPAETKLGFVVCESNSTGGALEPVGRKDTAAEAIKLARDIAATDEHVRVFHEIAFTVDHLRAPELNPEALRPDARDMLISRLVNTLNTAGMEVLEERMPSLIEITEALIEAKALGYVPTGSKAEPIKYPDTPEGRTLKQEHEKEREALRQQHERERKLYL